MKCTWYVILDKRKKSRMCKKHVTGVAGAHAVNQIHNQILVKVKSRPSTSNLRGVWKCAKVPIKLAESKRGQNIYSSKMVKATHKLLLSKRTILCMYLYYTILVCRLTQAWEGHSCSVLFGWIEIGQSQIVVILLGS